MHTDTIDLLVHRELPAATRGDRDAYGRIVAACQNAITAIALAITRDVSISEDIAQDAFISAWQKLNRLQNPASFLPWLRQITRNLARDHHRALVRRAVNGAAAELAIAYAADPSATPMQRLIDDERDAVAAELIAELPEESREILLLYYREGCSSRQVAALLGMSDAAVRKRLSRARQSVHESLLQRFADFARDSAPGSAFAVVVTASIGSLGKPAAAAGLSTGIVGSAGGLLGKTAVTGGVGAGVMASAAVFWIYRRAILRYADSNAERRDILRWYHSHCGLSFVGLVCAAVSFVAFESVVPAVAATVAWVAVMTWITLVPLRRIMAPMLARDAARAPLDASRRQLGYRLAFGVSGTIINAVASVWSLLVLIALFR